MVYILWSLYDLVSQSQVVSVQQICGPLRVSTEQRISNYPSAGHCIESRHDEQEIDSAKYVYLISWWAMKHECWIKNALQNLWNHDFVLFWTGNEMNKKRTIVIFYLLFIKYLCAGIRVNCSRKNVGLQKVDKIRATEENTDKCE